MRSLLLVVLSLALASLASSANILDLIYRGAKDPEPKQAAEQDNESTDQIAAAAEGDAEKTCDCTGVECMCCVDFNMTFIDLGKGCVRMKYISQSEGVLLNVSYGENLLRSGVSRGPQPSATCVSMIGQLAAVCARFTSLLPHDGGLKGCLKLEPKLLGDVQTRLSIGCFAMDLERGMRVDEQQEQEQQQEATTLAPNADAGTNQTNAGEGGGGGGNLNEDEILAAVNESAQKGLAFFQNWLGLDFSAHAANGTQEQGQQDGDGDAAEATDVSAQKAADAAST